MGMFRPLKNSFAERPPLALYNKLSILWDPSGMAKHKKKLAAPKCPPTPPPVPADDPSSESGDCLAVSPPPVVAASDSSDPPASAETTLPQSSIQSSSPIAQPLSMSRSPSPVMVEAPRSWGPPPSAPNDQLSAATPRDATLGSYAAQSHELLDILKDLHSTG